MKSLGWAILLIFLVGLPARAQSPLDRLVRLTAHDISLQEALDRIAASAGLRFSYSAETLQLDRRVSTAFHDVTVGAALTTLLDRTGVVPVAVSDNHVVLAPPRTPAQSRSETTPPVIPLEQIVVTGSTTGSVRRSLPFALDVIQGEELEKAQVSDLATALGASAPSLWLWPTAAASLIAQYGSIRGASSFGLSYPKIYVDGIEVANPLLFMSLIPEVIDRIETIRGPQGAALYGADAISGVINIVTRSDLSAAHGRSFAVHTRGGVAASAYATGAVLSQEHTATLGLGSNLRSLLLAASASTLGEYLPGVYAHNYHVSGQGRLIGSRASLLGTLRFHADELGLAEMTPHPLRDQPQTSRQYTFGLNGKLAADEIWTHALIAGVDGYRLRNISNAPTPFPSQIDSALRAARGSADRASLRLSSVGNFGDERAARTLTLAAEHSTLRQTVRDRSQSISTRRSTGMVAQANAGWADRWFLTAGLRVEHNSGLLTGSKVTWLPLLGGAALSTVGGTTLKLRAAYGKGIRPPQSAAGPSAMYGMRQALQRDELEPEEQAGIEAGFDWLPTDRLSLHLTRFDQRASGLIQQVAVVVTQVPPMPGGRRERISHELQNVGEILNRGWELEARYGGPSLAVAAAFALTDSRVERLAPGYSGDLRVGDAMLNVPRATSSFTLAWDRGPWYLGLGLSRAMDWVGYDRAALANDFTTGAQYHDLVGARLRAYWMDYEGVTRLRASAARELGRGLTLTIAGENLLNYQDGEPDNLTVLPGRTITLGVKARF